MSQDEYSDFDSVLNLLQETLTTTSEEFFEPRVTQIEMSQRRNRSE